MTKKNTQLGPRRFSGGRLREARGTTFSLAQVAAVCRPRWGGLPTLSGEAVRRWERGEGEPSATQLAAVATLLERPESYFFEEE